MKTLQLIKVAFPFLFLVVMIPNYNLVAFPLGFILFRIPHDEVRGWWMLFGGWALFIYMLLSGAVKWNNIFDDIISMIVFGPFLFLVFSHIEPFIEVPDWHIGLSFIPATLLALVGFALSVMRLIKRMRKKQVLL